MAERMESTREVVLECCLEGVESASQAFIGGAHRIELCANLPQGGVTPSLGEIQAALATRGACRTKVHVLIRPRPGGFVYSSLEKEVMKMDVSAAIKAGADGVVIGALREDGSIDEETTAALLREAAVAAEPGSCDVTFHRAFDHCTTEISAALETLIRLGGVNRVLTSGRAESAWEGRQSIAQLVAAARGRIVVMPGGGVTRANVVLLLSETGADEVHISSDCQESVLRSTSQTASICLGSQESSTVLKRVSANRVAEMLQTLEQCHRNE